MFGAHLTKPMTRRAIIEVISMRGLLDPPLQPAKGTDPSTPTAVR